MVLELAGEQADEIVRLMATLEADGITIAGSKGQRRLHPAVAELRQARLTVARLLGELSLPNAASEPESAASRRARRAAVARWDRRRQVGAHG